MRLPRPGCVYEFNLFGHESSFYWSTDNDSPDRSTNGRFSLMVGGTRLRLEYNFPSKRFSLGFGTDDDGDNLTATFCIPPIGLYGSGESDLFKRIADQVHRVFPSDMGFAWSGRRFGISIFDYALHWNFGSDSMGWTHKRPKWKDGSWYPIGFRRVQGEFEVLDTREVLVPMPERAYKGKAELHRYRWGFDKLPRFLDKIGYGVKIEMNKGEQIPFPGKGENSWDCGDDAAFGMSCKGPTINDAIGQLVASVLRDRNRYGGKSWTPEPEKTES